MTFRQGMMVLRSVCNSCQGEGKKITHPCETCRGNGIETKKVTEEITFPKGIDNDATMRFRGKGHNGGDL